MTATPWFKFYPANWLGEEKLGLCSLAARGLWIEMICIMQKAEPRGALVVNGKPLNPKQLAGLIKNTNLKQIQALLSELEEAGVFSRDDDGTIYSRRIRSDEEKAAQDKENGGYGGNPNIRRGTVPKDERVRPFKRTDSPEKAQRIFNRDSGRCHWCRADLLFSGKGGEPNLFHVDHILAVCDGGGNDEENLVAACAACNHGRKLNEWKPPSDPNGGVSVGKKPDTKAQKPEDRNQKEVGGGGSARDPDPNTLVGERAYQIVGELLGISGYSGFQDAPNGWVTAPMRVQAWLNSGWEPEIILAAARRRMSRKIHGSPPQSPQFFEPVIAEEHTRIAAPVPVVPFPQQRLYHDRASSPRPRTGVDWDATERNVRSGFGAGQGFSSVGPDGGPESRAGRGEPPTIQLRAEPGEDAPPMLPDRRCG